jgi:hypothetical protein
MLFCAYPLIAGEFDFEMPPDAVFSKPICGEESAPENIYYKFVRDNQAETFFYTLLTNIDMQKIGESVTAMLILPVGNSNGLLITLDIGFISQYSIVYEAGIILPEIEYAMYIIKQDLDMADLADAYYFLWKQFDFDYKMMRKQDLIKLLDDTFGYDMEVRIDDFRPAAPAYIRKPKQ